MKGQVALVREQGVEFAVVLVKLQLLRGAKSEKDAAVRTWSIEFGRPAVLMAQDTRGEMEFYGRRDLSQWLANNILDPAQLPWREFTAKAA